MLAVVEAGRNGVGCAGGDEVSGVVEAVAVEAVVDLTI